MALLTILWSLLILPKRQRQQEGQGDPATAANSRRSVPLTWTSRWNARPLKPISAISSAARSASTATSVSSNDAASSRSDVARSPKGPCWMC